MIRFYVGTDSHSKEIHLNTFISQRGAEARRFNDAGGFPAIHELSESTLFGPPQVFVFDNSLAKSGLLEKLEDLLKAPAEIIILEEAIPKRGSPLLELSKNPAIEIINFDPPEIRDLPAWLGARAEHHGASLSKDGASELVAALIPEPASSWEKPNVDLRQLDSELQKLATYTDGQPITADTVHALTKRNTETQVWSVINAIADKNSKLVFSNLEKFLSDNEASGDDKAKLILLNALLADQFRNILMMQDFLSRSIPDQAILGQTGWKSGRLYQVKKLAARFNPIKVRQILQRLEDLDIELKTSQTPARPIVDLILTQVL